MAKVVLKVKGMHCASCSVLINKLLGKQNGIVSVNTSYGAEKTSIEFDESKIKEKFKGKYKLMRGSVLNLPFENNSFDYVHCEGALHHTVDPKKGFMELARVCKPGGYLYISVFGTPGIFRIAEDALREEYKTNKNGLNLKEWVDNLNQEKLREIIKFLNDNRKGEDLHYPALPEEWFDEDLVVSIKDRLQAPIYTRHSTEEVKGWYKEAGFKTVERITRYPTGCYNIRRFMNPVYDNWDHPISKFLNGDGFIQVIGRK